jgi:hypothetical protein
MIQVEDKNNGVIYINSNCVAISDYVSGVYYDSTINALYDRLEELQNIVNNFVNKEDFNNFSKSVNNSLNEILKILGNYD